MRLPKKLFYLVYKYQIFEKFYLISFLECIATLKGHTSYVVALVELQNGDVISGSYDKTIKVWNIKTKTCIATLEGHTSNVVALVELQNGDVISGSWDTRYGKLRINP